MAEVENVSDMQVNRYAGAAAALLPVPNPPYTDASGKLTSEVKKFLKKVMNLFSEDDEERLDQGGLMSLMLFGYPDTEVEELAESVTTMLTMKGENFALTHEQVYSINETGATNEEAFTTMLQNMNKSYADHERANRFLKKSAGLGLPVPPIEPLQLMLFARQYQDKSGNAESSGKVPGVDETVEGMCLDSLDMAGVVKKIKEAKNIMIMAGAGISTSCGIPDFRTPGTGLYDNLQKYNLPEPTSVFNINFFHSNPKPFALLSKELYPDNFLPSPTHYFCSLLAKKGKLKRMYSQNIDGIETLAGMPNDLLVPAHGNFNSSTCTKCGKKWDKADTKKMVFQDEPPRCDECNALVKADITFFGEALPKRFFETLKEDTQEADLLIVMGTSLQVSPFCTIKDKVQSSCPRVLLNMEPAGEAQDLNMDPDLMAFIDKTAANFKEFPTEWKAFRKIIIASFTEMFGGDQDGFVFPPKKGAYRDVFLQGKCDEQVFELCAELGWADELTELINETNAALKEAREKEKNVSAE